MRADTDQTYRQRVQRVLGYIQRRLDETVSLEELAAVAHFSPYHFHRIFRGMVGESVMGHVRRLRLERAAHRLKFTDQPVTRIAFDAGYETHESFTRAFKSVFEQPPSAFREAHQRPPYPAVPSGVHYTPDAEPNFEPQAPAGPPVSVRIERLSAMRVLSMPHVGPYDGVGGTWQKLFAFASSRGLVGMMPTTIGMAHDDPAVTPAHKLRYDACLAIGAADVEIQGDFTVRTIGDGEYAMTAHRGPYDGLGDTYARLCGEWLPNSGRELRWAPSLEFYRNSPLTTPAKDLWTDVYLPLTS